ncbi:MAG: cysteine desulfurase-like protein [Streptosporangiales bacterium]
MADEPVQAVQAAPAYDVRAVRAEFPALAEGAAHFDGPGGSQVPSAVADAVGATLRAAVANRGTETAAARRADGIVVAARDAIADLLGVEPDGVVFGRSMTQLTYDVARTLAKGWGPGDEVVVSALDHDGNVRPWVQAAEASGATVRWAEFDPETGELAPEAVGEVLTERTKLVAVTAASNLIGTRPDVAVIADLAHRAGAMIYVDGVHATPHTPVDVSTLGADFYACSTYKFLGPHLGVVVAAPATLDRLSPDRLLPMPDAGPERFEFGTLPYELLAGTTAAVDFLAGLVPGDGARRDRLLRSMNVLEAYEWGMFERLRDELARIPGVLLYGHARRRTPTALFSVHGVPAATVAARLAERGVNAPAGTFYAVEGARRLGLMPDGAVRAGLAPYTDESDIDRLLDGVRALFP